MRLIDADALKKEIAKQTPHFAQRIEFTPCFKAIRDAPTVDAVPMDELKNRDVTFYDKGKAFEVFFPIGLDLDTVNRVKIRDREFVPVVRCGECKWLGIGAEGDGTKLMLCIKKYHDTTEEDYCSEGVNREDDPSD